jgi:hypothetical protein
MQFASALRQVARNVFDLDDGVVRHLALLKPDFDAAEYTAGDAEANQPQV